MTAAPQVPVHRVSGRTLATLARIRGGSEAVHALLAGQWSKRLLLLRAVVHMARERAPEQAREAGLDQAYDLLARVQQKAPEAFREVLLHPYTDAWASHCVRRLEAPRPERDSGLVTDLGHLAALAAAGAARAGLEDEVVTPVRDGWAVLPTLGRLRTGGVRDRVALRPGTLTRSGGAAWEPLRTVERHSDGGAAPALCLRVDDMDPYRGLQVWRPAPRLDDRDFARWESALGQAWRLLAAHHPWHAEAVAAGLTTVVPLPAPEGDRGDISSASQQAFGAIASSLPADPADLAGILVHEFLHLQLGALLDLVALCERRPSRERLRYRAPWRSDPRPVQALLQGAYAHLGVTDFWRVHRWTLRGSGAERAHREFALWRALTAEALATLEESSELTDTGRGFVTGMGEALCTWLAEPVPPAPAASAARQVGENRARWSLCWGSAKVLPPDGSG